MWEMCTFLKKYIVNLSRCVFHDLFALFCFLNWLIRDFLFLPCFAVLHMLLLPLLPIKFISLNVDEKSLSKIHLPAQNHQSVNNGINKVACTIAWLEISEYFITLNQFVRFSLNKSYYIAKQHLFQFLVHLFT